MAKLWAGRFQKETDLVVNDFNSSILFDCRLYKEDITGSIAHATMLGKQGIIEEHEAEKIVEGLKGILKDIEDGNVEFSLDYEDIHMNVEQLLTERIGDTGKRLHTGRSRNDQADSAGFINLFGLPLKVRALNNQMLYAKTGEHFPSVEK